MEEIVDDLMAYYSHVLVKILYLTLMLLCISICHHFFHMLIEPLIMKDIKLEI